MAGKQWPECKRKQVLESYALSGNLSETSREAGVPKSTIKRWVTQGSREVERMRRRNEEVGTRVIEESLEAVLKRHAELARAMQSKALEELGKVRRTTATGVASLAEKGVKIERLALGVPAETVEVKGRMLDDAIEALISRLATEEKSEVSDDAV